MIFGRICMELSDSVYNIKGVGQKTGQRLEKLNIYTVNDLITHYPREYDDRRDIKKIDELEVDKVNTFIATIAGPAKMMKRGNLIIVSAHIRDSTGDMMVVFYGQPYIKKILKIGKVYLFTGKVSYKYGRLQLESPDYKKIVNREELDSLAKILPVYPTTNQLSQKRLGKFIETTLDSVEGQIKENIPLWIKEKYKLADRSFAIRNIHFPASNEDFFRARDRIVFEELFIYQISMFLIKERLHQDINGIEFKKDPFIDEFTKSLPFELTNAQKNVFKEVERDMISPKVMNRLIQGDVGSGKTIVAVLALVLAAKNGYQGAFMVPTEVLASQHYKSLTKLLNPFNIRVGLLVGSLTAKNKNEINSLIKEHEIDIVVGTHALIQDGVEFSNLGLVITDEQHRFGVRQRVSLSEKGYNPDVIVMTATPIPRTLALILYGDLDISVIDELPPGRQEIETFAVNRSYRPRIYKFIEKHIDMGRQAYIICPMVEESEEMGELEDVIGYTEELRSHMPSHINIQYLHGQMKPKDKEEIMHAFANNQIQVLVSTTVIEVGVDVPNATVMVIEDAQRFGLAQLHQLRGRVGRGKHQSYCILVNDSKSKISKERMKVMEETNDGFIISEKDLSIRGPGEFFGTRQHGLPDMKIANLYQDISILKPAQKAAKELIKNDPKLVNPEHKDLRNDIIRLFKDRNMSASL